MMNGEGPSVPITILIGIQSLNDVLLELPLPTPLPSIKQQSLLSHLRNSEEARQHLNTKDSTLISPLIDALSCTSTEHIEVKDGYYGGGGSYNTQVSQLMQCLLRRDPGLFKGFTGLQNRTGGRVPSEQWLQRQCSNISVHHPQHIFNASAIPQDHPCQSQGSIPDNYPLEHPSAPQNASIIQNKVLNAPPETYVSYSPYTHTTTTSSQQHSVLHNNIISRRVADSLTLGLRESPQMSSLSSNTQHILNVPQSSPAVHSSNHMNGIYENDLSFQQNSEAKVLAAASTIQHTNSSDITVEQFAPFVNSTKHPAVPSLQSLPSGSFDSSELQTNAKQNSNGIHNSVQESTIQPLSIHGSNPNKESEILNQRDKNMSNPTISEKKVSVKQPVVTVLEKQPVAVLEKQPVAVLEKQPVVALEKQPVVALEKQPVVALEKQPVVALEKQPVVALEKQPVVALEKQPVVALEKQPSVTLEKQPTVTHEKRPSVALKKKPAVTLEKQPAVSPKKQPAVTPEKQPAVTPKKQPAVAPKKQPAVTPKKQPAVTPKNQPDVTPKKQPAVTPKKQPDVTPKKQPTVTPKNQPAVTPKKQPAVALEKQPVVVLEKQPLVVLEKHPVVVLEKQPAAILEKQPTAILKKQPAVSLEKQPVVVLEKLSDDLLLTFKSTEQQRDRNSSKKSTPRKNHHKNEHFSDHKNKDKGSKRKLDLSPERLNDSPSTSSRGRKRQCVRPDANFVLSSASEDEDSDESYTEKPAEPTASSISKAKKAKNKKIRKEFNREPLSLEELMDTNTYQRFSRIVDVIIDSMEDIDFSAMKEDDAECASEGLIPLKQLQELSNEAAKLKRLQAMNQFPPERLVRLLVILERNIIDGAKLLPVQMMEEQDEETQLWLELAVERVMRSADASLTALYIMTSPKMPKKVFLEDVIERIVHFIKYQLQNTVFPIFDPAYRLDPKSKDGYAGNIKQKRAHAHKVKEKSMLQLYNKVHEAVSILPELLELQVLTDTIILQASTLGVAPFFVEGIGELQLSALRLVTTIFARYHKHRQLILEDILASIARLPTSKRSLRNYRLNSEENIQMLTALILQLIHSVVHLPEPEGDSQSKVVSNEELKSQKIKENVYVDKDVLIVTSYNDSVHTAVSFLSVFLKKCGTKNEEIDYRPLFENFVQDLLKTVNKPEWPASELLLSILGRLLVKNFSNKSMDMTLRVASLDYLGIVAARLRKDAVTSQDRKAMINEVIQRIVADNDDLDSSPSKSKKKMKNKKSGKLDETQILQKALLQYLDSNATDDPALQFSRKFYIAQWYTDAATEIKHAEKSLDFPKVESENSDPVIKNKKNMKEESEEIENSDPVVKNKKHRSKTHRRSLRTNSEKEEEECEEIENSDPIVKNKKNHSKTHRKSSQTNCEKEEVEEKEESKLECDEMNVKGLALAEERKRFLFTVIKQQEPLKIKEEKHIDYKTAELISQYLASGRHFSKSFDLYLSQILRVLSETAVAVRTKAMKCLTLVVEADPSILARPDLQKGVHGRFLDHSTSVREAAVDLLGKFILIRPELTSQYYEMLVARILDTGVSVRKRVIKILKDICVEQPDFPKTPEICVKIIRRVNDEDGIKKLVGEAFQSMWFSPVSDKKQDKILQKVKNIIQVVEACRDTGLEWFEQLLTNLLKNKEDSNYKAVMKSCKQIVDCLVENLLQLEESQNVDDGVSPHLAACLATIYLFCKIHPPFVVPHAATIQPYLAMKYNTPPGFLLLKNVAQTLEVVVPLIEHPSSSFLAQIEEEIVKLIFCYRMGLLPSSVSCLGAIINKVTHNYQLVRECFQKFFAFIERCKNANEIAKSKKPTLLRSLYTVGLFCCHFDFNAIENGSEQEDHLSLQSVFESMIHFSQQGEEDIRLKALTGLGFMMIRHYDFMLGSEVKTLYHYLLTSPVASSVLKCQVLKNITNYLVEEEMKMIKKDAEWKETSKSEDLKEMCDVTSGMASTVIQIYLKQVLECVLHTEISVRRACLSVMQLILSQGLIHPVQVVPYLVCLGSDDEPAVRTKADQLIQEIERKYPGFIQMKAIFGVRMSYKMQQSFQNQDEIVRGFRCPETPVSRNSFLYSVIRSTRQSRRAFVLSLLKLFDEQLQTPLTELLYISDNIAYFPYVVQDEPLFIMHQLDIMLSVSGSNLLQTFQETLLHRQANETDKQDQPSMEVDDYDDDDSSAILERLPEDTTALQECIFASQGCILLLYIKQTLKEMYGFTDNKIQQYSPNETAKVHERPLNRKSHVRFNPETVLNFIKTREFEGELDEQGREKLVSEYLSFKQLMLTIDPDDDDEEGGNPTKTGASTVSCVPESTEKTVESKSDETKPAPVQSPSEKTKTPSEKIKTPSSKYKSPLHSRSSLRKSSRTPKVKVKVKTKHKKKRKRLLDSASDDSGSDSDFVESS